MSDIVADLHDAINGAHRSVRDDHELMRRAASEINRLRADPFALARALRDLGYIVSRITTADGRTERDERALPDAGAELNKLAAYFRHEAMSDGFEGDVEGESPVDTAIRVMRRKRGST